MPQTKVGPGLLGNPNILRFQFTSWGIGSISVVGQLMCWSSRLAFGKVFRLAANDDTFKDFVILCTTTQFFTRKPIYNLPVDTDTWVSSSQNIQIHLENLDSSSIFIISLLHWDIPLSPMGFEESILVLRISLSPRTKRPCRCLLPSECCGAVQKVRAARGICIGFTAWLETKIKHGDFPWYFLYGICIRKHVQI